MFWLADRDYHPLVLVVPALKLAAVLLIAGVLLGVIMIVMMARALLRPRRMTDVRALLRLNRMSPEDLGLVYQSLTFRVRDAQQPGTIDLAAWWMPREPAAPAGRCVVLLHGYGDAKIGAIAWAPMFHERGWNVCAIDLRAHGESDGLHSTAGYYERHDLQQALGDLRARFPDETHTLLLFGVSLGGAVALATADLCQREGEPVAGVICDSPFADYYKAVAAHGEILGFPGGLFRDIALKLAERISGARFGEVRPVDLIPLLDAPLKIVLAGDDPFVPPRDAQLIEDAARQREDRVTVVWHVPECPHIFGLAHTPDNYLEQVDHFLERITRRGSAGRQNAVLQNSDG